MQFKTGCYFMTYSIKQVSDLTGIPASTLRYYESEKLLSPVHRSETGRRVYGEKDMDWLSLITCLKNTGMPINKIRRFVSLCSKGDETLQERYQIILTHKKSVEDRIAGLQRELEHINYKELYYRTACKAGTERELKKLKYPESKNCGFAYLISMSSASSNDTSDK